MKVKSEREVAQSCPTLSDPMDFSLPGSSVHGIFQARVLEWGAIVFKHIQNKIMASLVAQLVKNSPAMRKTRVRSKGWEDPLEKGKATHFSILAWRISSMSDFHFSLF